MALQSLVINLFSGPSAGKSTMATGLFNKLKTQNINSEYVDEYAKHLVWSENYATLANQIYVSATQYYKEWILYNKVDVIITDSPIILGLIYWSDKTSPEYKFFYSLLIELFKKQNSINFFINRSKPYNKTGRIESEDQAKLIDSLIKEMLIDNNINFMEVSGDNPGLDIVFKEVLQRHKNV